MYAIIIAYVIFSAEDEKSVFLDLQFSVDLTAIETFSSHQSQHACSLLLEDRTFLEQFGVASQVREFFTGLPVVF